MFRNKISRSILLGLSSIGSVFMFLLLSSINKEENVLLTILSLTFLLLTIVLSVFGIILGLRGIFNGARTRDVLGLIISLIIPLFIILFIISVMVMSSKDLVKVLID